jgi:hypothetical protein
MRDLSNAVFANAGELFCFSESDPLCLAEGVDEFIQKRKEKGSICIQLRLADSPHCQHMRKYPALYFERCKELHFRSVRKWRVSHGLSPWEVGLRQAAL